MTTRNRESTSVSLRNKVLLGAAALATTTTVTIFAVKIAKVNSEALKVSSSCLFKRASENANHCLARMYSSNVMDRFKSVVFALNHKLYQSIGEEHLLLSQTWGKVEDLFLRGGIIVNFVITGIICVSCRHLEMHPPTLRAY